MKYSKYLLVIAIFLCSSILTAYAYIGNIPVASDGSAEEMEYLRIIVEAGDSVWNLAQEYNNGKYNTKKLVNQIISINGLEQSTIFPGQALIIPL